MKRHTRDYLDSLSDLDFEGILIDLYNTEEMLKIIAKYRESDETRNAYKTIEAIKKRLNNTLYDEVKDSLRTLLREAETDLILALESDIDNYLEDIYFTDIMEFLNYGSEI